MSTQSVLGLSARETSTVVNVVMKSHIIHDLQGKGLCEPIDDGGSE